MLEKKYENALSKILDALENCYFEDLDEYNFRVDVVEPFKEKYENNVAYAYGSTKGVLIFKDLGFVIKMPFKYYDGDYFCGAAQSAEKWNYCEQEENRYIEARNNGLEKVFLPTERIAFAEHPMYIQEYADILIDLIEYDDDSNSSHTLEDENIVSDIMADYSTTKLNVGWSADVYALYGEDYYFKLMDYLDERNYHDLRTANIGYKNRMPVIVDYAEFNE